MAASAELRLLLDRRLAGLRLARPDLADALELQEQLIRATLDSRRAPLAEPFPIPRDQLLQRVQHGVPLLHDQPAQVDVHYAADLFSRLVNVLQQRGDPELHLRLASLVDAATAGRLDAEPVFGEAFVGHRDHLYDLAHRAGVDAELLEALAAQAVAPLLRAYAERLLPLLERADDGSSDGAVWHAGYCPICGGWPAQAELRGPHVAQSLRCSVCGSAWRRLGLACPYCSNDDPRLLRSLRIDGEQRFHLSVCERCHGYLKVGNAFDPLPPELLALDEATTRHLDAAAIERGYQRPTGRGYTVELAVPEDEWLEELA